MKGEIEVEVPLIGMKTYAKSKKDIPVAISEAVIAFCIAAEKFGNGIEAELAEVPHN